MMIKIFKVLGGVMKKAILMVIISVTTCIIGILGIKTEMKGKVESQVSETRDYNGVLVSNEFYLKGNEMSGKQATIY